MPAPSSFDSRCVCDVLLPLNRLCLPRQGGDSEEEDAERTALKTAIKASLSRQRDETFTSLAFAAKAGDVELVRQYLRRGAEINEVDYDGRTVLAMVRR